MARWVSRKPRSRDSAARRPGDREEEGYGEEGGRDREGDAIGRGSESL